MAASTIMIAFEEALELSNLIFLMDFLHDRAIRPSVDKDVVRAAEVSYLNLLDELSERYNFNLEYLYSFDPLDQTLTLDIGLPETINNLIN